MCGEVTRTETIPKLSSHTYSSEDDLVCDVCGEERCLHKNTTVLEAVPQTCEKTGLTEGLKCDDCGEIIKKQTTIPTHFREIIEAIEGDCYMTGQTEGIQCSVCYHVIKEPQTTPPLGHTGGDWIVDLEPTEYDPGYRCKICIRCGEVCASEEIPPVSTGDGSLGLNYEVNENGICIIGRGNYSNSILNIPSKIRGMNVIGIMDEAFKNCTEFTGITIPTTVKWIGNSAFEGCSNVTYISIPSSYNLTTIGDYAFKNCSSISEITIPSSVTSVGKAIFSGTTNLGKVEYHTDAIPATPFTTDTHISIVEFGGETLHAEVLNFSQIGTLTLLGSVKTIGDGALMSCSKLEKVTFGSNVKSIGNNAFAGCGSLKSIEIPDSVTHIGESAFAQCVSLTSVTLPSKITAIELNTFQFCSSLKSITIPSNVTIIKEGAFSYCTQLKTATFPASLKTIEQLAFMNCNALTKINYAGSSSDWGKISISTNLNDPILDANKVYNYK